MLSTVFRLIITEQAFQEVLRPRLIFVEENESFLFCCRDGFVNLLTSQERPEERFLERCLKPSEFRSLFRSFLWNKYTKYFR